MIRLIFPEVKPHVKCAVCGCWCVVADSIQVSSPLLYSGLSLPVLRLL
jgi:hypothetical protein